MPTHLDRIDQALDVAFRSALVRRLAWAALRRGIAADRLGCAFGRDLIRSARTPFGRELVRVLHVAAIVRQTRQG